MTVAGATGVAKQPLLEPLDLGQLPNAARLLITTVRVFLGTASRSDIQECLKGEIDWRWLEQACQWHRLQGILFKVFRDGKYAEVPEAFLKSLEAHYRGNAGRNLKLTSLLFALLGAFNGANIPVLVIKGLALAGPLYGDVALRRSSDLDVLVEPSDVPAAMELLCNMEGCTTPVLEPQALALLLKTDNEMKIFLNGILVELQWRLGPLPSSYNATTTSLFKEAENISMAGRGVPTLGNVEMLPYLCFHGSKHLWYRLFWLMDVAAWLNQRASVDWEQLLDRSCDRGHDRAFLLGLGLVHHLFAIPLPEPILKCFGFVPGLTQRVAYVRDFLLLLAKDPYEPVVSNYRLLENVYWMYPSWGWRARWAGRYFFQPTLKDWEALPIAGKLGLLHLVRPFRLIGLALGIGKGGGPHE